MGQDYIDAAKAGAEADRIVSVTQQNLNQVFNHIDAEAKRIASGARRNLKQIFLTLRNCLQVVHKTRQMLEVNLECICVNSNYGKSKWKRRREPDKAVGSIEIVFCNIVVELENRLPESNDMLVQPKHPAIVRDDNLLWCDCICVYEKVNMDNAVWCTTPPTVCHYSWRNGRAGTLEFWNQGEEMHLYVCNPLMQAWRKLPLPLQVQGFDLVHLVTQTKRYTITIVSNLQQNEHHITSVKAIVEVYNSATKTWNASSNSVFHLGGNNLFYYKKYMEKKFARIRAYNKTTDYSTNIPFHLSNNIIFSEKMGFYPMAEHEGQVYVLRTEEAKIGVWVQRTPSHMWEKLYSVLNPRSSSTTSSRSWSLQMQSSYLATNARTMTTL